MAISFAEVARFAGDGLCLVVYGAGDGSESRGGADDQGRYRIYEH
ncbi:hypothetical protein [Blautia sp. MSJ-9]|nr:hypothetical protein [Blautia sp. MSJ-9]